MLNIRSGNPNRYLIRGIFSFAVGITIMVVPDLTLTLVIRFLGALLVADGLIALLIQYFSKKNQNSPFMILPRGTVSLIFGAVLLIFPGLVVNFFVFLIGFILVFAGITQFASQISGRSLIGTSWIIIIISLISFLTGVLFITKPFESAQTMLIIFGVMIGLYGLGEVFWSFRLRKLQPVKKDPASNIIDAEYEEVE
jgi:membrane protein HdeD